MCELLGMSANVPTDICFSFTGLIQRGGQTGPHRDGWGIAFYEGHGCRSFCDPTPGASSQLANMIKSFPIKSEIVISHIRQANHGKVCLANTHPFIRELWGRHWAFAHNGQLKGIKKRRLTFYKPVGTTDSEYAFCWMLDNIRKKFPKPPKSQKLLWSFIRFLADDISELGVFNLMLSDSQCLYCYCGNHLAWITRRAPFGAAELLDKEVAVNFSQLTTPNDVVSIITTKPLTKNESWEILAPNDFLVFKKGELKYWVGYENNDR